MRYFLILMIIISFQSCNKKEERKEPLKSQDGLPKAKVDSASSTSSQTVGARKDTLDEVMLADDILFNGKLKRFFNLNDFEKVFGKVDSTRLLSDLQPCSYIFEDEGDGQNDKYLYKNGSCFENSKQKVGVNEFRFLNGNYILYKGIKIDSKSTVDDIRKIFPNSVRNMDNLDMQPEGILQVITLREDNDNISDGHINIYFKNNKVHSIHWWFPC